jgi:dTDP-glucose 4,6-dehydratase
LRALTDDEARAFRFVHVSTDEVFGALGHHETPFDESTRYAPRSPYSASKVPAGHLVRAWSETYRRPTIITNCFNAYGPFQFPEKLIPLMIIKAISGEPLPIYGRGENIRDWLHVEDHAAALVATLERGAVGDTYVVGGSAEPTNLDVARTICDLFDDQCGMLEAGPRRELIEFVTDRPGHDLRNAIDSSKIQSNLGWRPTIEFSNGLARTVSWYVTNDWWWKPIQALTYDGHRLGRP